ncbi:hypothetical protein OZK63_35700 [Streptomyces sp. UMAF16]|nr:hypothetical protein [Streptomyces sp. UMAF16]
MAHDAGGHRADRQTRHLGVPLTASPRSGLVPLGWVRSPQPIEVRFGTSRAGAVDVALYTTASVDTVVPAHPEADWEQLRAVEKGRRSPLASLRPEPVAACA